MLRAQIATTLSLSLHFRLIALLLAVDRTLACVEMTDRGLSKFPPSLWVSDTA